MGHSPILLLARITCVIIEEESDENSSQYPECRALHLFIFLSSRKGEKMNKTLQTLAFVTQQIVCPIANTCVGIIGIMYVFPVVNNKINSVLEEVFPKKEKPPMGFT